MSIRAAQAGSLHLRIAIIVHSASGHTSRIALALAEALRARGHEADAALLRTTGRAMPGSRTFRIRNMPGDLQTYDVIFFGAPVWLLRLSPVMSRCLREVSGLRKKRVVPFVTMGLPWPAFGGTQALKAMTSLLDMSGASVEPGRVIHYLLPPGKERLGSITDGLIGRIESPVDTGDTED